jgi:hypothetical protein
MRGFNTTTSDESNSNYGLGVLSGIILTLLGIIAVRAAEWAATNPVIDATIAWATTPSIAPVDLAGPIMLVLIICSVMGMMVY